jgi:uncharacterized protein YmfQ (DUF2313 family)
MTAPAPRTPAQVLGELLALTPPGWALPHDPASVWATFLQPWASEASLIETTAASMLNEIDPRSAVYSLPDFQRVLGPDPYGRDAASQELSEAALATLEWSRWAEGGNMAPSDYIALAATMGVTITIQEYWPSVAGLFAADGCVGCDLPRNVAGVLVAGDTLGADPLAFYWLVRLPTYQSDPAEAGTMRAGDLVSTSLATPVPAVILGEAPSHTIPTFLFTG